MTLPAYHAPSWLIGAHLQTIWPVLAQRRRITWQRSIQETPDGDIVAIDSRPGRSDQPLLVLFHGLEGSSKSHYATTLAHHLEQQGWGLVIPHFRGCGGLDNRLARAYFAGDSAEIEWALQTIHQQYPQRPLFAAGISLGGNALLKWLGEQGQGAARYLQAAAGISAPVDLTASGQALRHGFNRQVYTRHFIHTLIPKTMAKLKKHPELAKKINHQALRAADTLHEFDDLYTAPIHGYRDAKDYWLRASSKPGLKNIAIPTLVLNALNDPFVPSSSLPRQEDVSEQVSLLQPKEGGHVGFTQGLLNQQKNWLPIVLMHFFSRHLHNGLSAVHSHIQS